jgi:hypothetical protein
VGGDFICNSNRLSTLRGAPNEVGGSFSCTYNGFRTLDGCPAKIGSDLNINNNYLNTLLGCPTNVGGVMHIYPNTLDGVFTTHFQRLRGAKQTIFLSYMNYYDVWTPEFNVANMMILIDDIMDGLE